MTDIKLEKSPYDALPERMGWDLNVAHFTQRDKSPQYLRLSFPHTVSGYSNIFIDHANPTSFAPVVTTRGYTDYEDERQLHTFQQKERTDQGFLKGFPYLRYSSGVNYLGVEICSDPNDIEATARIYKLLDVAVVEIADGEQVGVLYRLENELMNRIGSDKTEFLHPTPTVFDMRSNKFLHRPLSDEERNELRMSLPYTFHDAARHPL